MNLKKEVVLFVRIYSLGVLLLGFSLLKKWTQSLDNLNIHLHMASPVRSASCCLEENLPKFFFSWIAQNHLGALQTIYYITDLFYG